MKKKRKILLMYITKVSGHRQATIAIQQTLRQMDSEADIPSVNGFGYTYPLLEKIVNRAYMRVIKSTPMIWDYLYDNPKIVKRSQSIKNFLHKTSYKKLARLFERYQPDTVVCTQAFPCGMVADYKRTHNLNLTLIGVLTDFLPHAYWINEGVDYYVVPCEEARDHLISEGVNPGAIRVFGIPVRSKFAQRLNKEQLFDEFGLNLKIPTILIMGGGQGLGPIKRIVQSFLKLSTDFQIIVIAGTNKKLIKWLKDKTMNTQKRILVYQYVKNVYELMEMANLIVTKPGGMTTAESLVKGLPMMLINPIPGQEMRNADFLKNNGIAVQLNMEADIGTQLEDLLRNPDKLRAMSHAALRHAKPNAAKDIAKLILEHQSSPVFV